jgi:hypothetical protein
MKKIMISILISILLMLGTSLNVYADGGEPPSPGSGECFVGPSIVGTLILTDNGDGSTLSGTFRGFCRYEFVKKNICDFLYGVPFAAIAPENIIGLRFLGSGFEDCRSRCGGEDLIIYDVKKFKNTGRKIIAEIVLKYIIYISEGEPCPSH